MYRTCISCHGPLGENREVACFPVGVRLAFDRDRGRLWVVCPHCHRWNLTPLEERWEAVEWCEARFRSTPLRASTGEVALTRLPSGLELIRIGRALRPELAAWRYGRRYRSLPGLTTAAGLLTRLRLRVRADRVVAVVPGPGGAGARIRHRHLADAELLRPDRLEPWRLLVQHETGPLLLSGRDGLRAAGKLLAALNGTVATPAQVQAAVRRLEDAGNPESYFGRVAALSFRTSWGRFPDARRDLPFLAQDASPTERLALFLTNRSFWARGALGSEPRAALPRLSLEDRLALEMAAHEDTERRALEGELRELERAWREAEEIAAIADGLLDDPGDAAPPLARVEALSLPARP